MTSGMVKRRADADQRRALLHGHLPVLARSHRELLQAVRTRLRRRRKYGRGGSAVSVAGGIVISPRTSG